MLNVPQKFKLVGDMCQKISDACLIILLDIHHHMTDYTQEDIWWKLKYTIFQDESSSRSNTTLWTGTRRRKQQTWEYYNWALHSRAIGSFNLVEGWSDSGLLPQ